jgi:hypothetical protein
MMPCEDEGRGRGHLTTNQRIPQRLPANHQKLGEKHGSVSSSHLLEETNSENSLILGF